MLDPCSKTFFYSFKVYHEHQNEPKTLKRGLGFHDRGLEVEEDPPILGVWCLYETNAKTIGLGQNSCHIMVNLLPRSGTHQMDMFHVTSWASMHHVVVWSFSPKKIHLLIPLILKLNHSGKRVLQLTTSDKLCRRPIDITTKRNTYNMGVRFDKFCNVALNFFSFKYLIPLFDVYFFFNISSRFLN